MENLIVIKIGGVASKQLSQGFMKQIKNWKQAGKQVIIVHGGGFAINKLMEERQLAVEKVDGLRVTSHEVMKLVAFGLLEQVGKDIVASLNAAGCDCLQLRANLGKVIQAGFLDKKKYGYVGNVTGIHTAYLEELLQEGLIPVLASMGGKGDELLNINADYVATALAIALKAERLILMTDVPGVKEDGQVISQLSTKQAQEKIRSGVITGGMVPKIKGASETVEAGVQTVLISDNLVKGTLIHLT
ncbi:acetylglutamate kinase [Streptococcus suis]|uniref:Acetylglutamate kinase n=1 Tax=Streptococcus suis R61 TaxID=996306 RepID=A0AA87K4Y1_STRSU|nr:acetylglutamate kinase [Streptococcus suis]EHC02868.1 N-acetylglutamate 5-phosphotransferase [Streptococcus suis R61]MBY4954755.1 acetylglutamate kinase [Streptococcus suis]MBY4969549.1 acetylglutamate kinase [Streptococcus suis]MBY5000350.1 acetylglutamate kinase [Streptococcus suis]MBY5012236.1 acetylglutamate kinase [Streptococcus suis]